MDVDGQRLGDSQLILEHLTRTREITLDAHLTAGQRAVGHAVRRMLEEGSYWGLVHERWQTEAGWAAYQPVFRGLLPPVVGWAVLPMIRGTVRRQLRAQGTGRHTDAEIAHLLCADLDAVADVLGEQAFLLGERPSSVDASVYGLLASIQGFPVQTPGRCRLEQDARLVAYVARIRARWWAEAEMAESPAGT